MDGVIRKGESIAMAEIKLPIYVNLPDDWKEQIVNRLRNDPEAEWVEIVRCKDCKYHSHDAGYGRDWCNRTSGVFRVKPDDFCSRAERRQE